VWFGHRRLSIIDLSHAGDQPMHSPDGRYVLIFNGEIYNYVELRQELIALGASFTSHSDSEVIIEGYRVWGRKVVDRLNGMFAFMILDRQA
ncbi:asparagine synthetase B, partial [Acinetobacter baumannii]